MCRFSCTFFLSASILLDGSPFFLYLFKMDNFNNNNFNKINFNQFSKPPGKTKGVIETIILINVIMFIPFLLYKISEGSFYYPLALVTKFLNLNINAAETGRMSISNGAIWQVITSMFLHGGLGHIFFNMYALYIFGKPIEQRWGKKDFVIFYLFCGIFANILSIPIFMLYPHPVSLLGASGAVYGVLLAFGTYYPETKLLLFFVIPIRTKWAILGFAALSIYFQISGSFGSIAHVTHLFGFLAAFLYIFFVKKINPIKKMFFPDKDDYIIY